MKKLVLLGILFAGGFAAFATFKILQPRGLSLDELDLAQNFSLSKLPAAPASPSNAFAENAGAFILGQAFFNDTGFSSNGAVACATCHLEDRQFQDDLPLSNGVGTTERRAMPLRGVAYASWLFWDGHKDTLWSQALGPIESPVEHNFTRAEVAMRIIAEYRTPYETLFGPLADLAGIGAASPVGGEEARANWGALSQEKQSEINHIFANFGKSIAAFERSLAPVENRFDRHIAALLQGIPPRGDAALNAQELAGYRLFVGKAECLQCHNGPRLTDEFFHNTGVASPDKPVTDHGRRNAIAKVEGDIFNCFGPFSDAEPEECEELRFISAKSEEFERAFKTPSLRGVATRPPYMHTGQMRTLSGVVEHYNRANPAPLGRSEIAPLNLTTDEKAALIAFLKTL